MFCSAVVSTVFWKKDNPPVSSLYEVNLACITAIFEHLRRRLGACCRLSATLSTTPRRLSFFVLVVVGHWFCPMVLCFSRQQPCLCLFAQPPPRQNSALGCCMHFRTTALAASNAHKRSLPCHFWLIAWSFLNVENLCSGVCNWK